MRCDKNLRSIDHVDLLKFLEHLYFGEGLGYSALNTARSAVSLVTDLLTNNPIGRHNMVCRFMKGVFNERPSMPRYKTTWDIDIVLKHLNYDSTTFSLRMLAKKFATLLAILSAQRVATISQIKWRDLHFTGNLLVIPVTEVVKQTRPGRHQKPLEFARCNLHKHLCMVTQADVYLQRTRQYRGDKNAEKLSLTTTSPYHSASKNTLSNWIREVLDAAGIKSAPHSTRSASASKAASILPLDTVLQAGGWSASSSTFPRYYNKPIVNQGIDLPILQGLQS